MFKNLLLRREIKRLLIVKDKFKITNLMFYNVLKVVVLSSSCMDWMLKDIYPRKIRF